MTLTGWTVDEVDAQMLEVLPRKETLFFNINITNVIGVNLALAVNAASIGTSAMALANQQLVSVSH
jgi:hypothetical protein